MPFDKSKKSKRTKTQKDLETHPQPEEKDKKNVVEAESDVDSDSDDEELFDLAQKWAVSQETKGNNGVVKVPSHVEDEKTAKKKQKNIASDATGGIKDSNLFCESTTTSSIEGTRQRNQFSLHVTNLPYNATKEEIVQTFVEKGCRVISTRLVYNYHTSKRDNEKKKTKVTNSNGFTGVAFVDVADERSYKLGLEMDKGIWGQSHDHENDQQFGRGWKRRRINVRPTKTKDELAQIVAQTKLKLAAQKQVRQEGDDEKQPLSQDKQTGSKQGQDSSSKNNAKCKALHSPEKKRKRDNNNEPSSLTKKKKKPKTEEKKLTKKERAKKAAILRTKKIAK